MTGLILVLVFFLVLVGGGVLLFYTGGSASPSETSSTSRPSPEDLSDPNELIQLAEDFESKKQWDRASRTWSRLVEVEPDRTDAYFRRGICFYRTENYDRAIQDFEVVLESDQEAPPPLHLYLGRAYRNLDQYGKALRHFQNYVELGDPGAQTIRTVADMARHLEKWSQASTYYEQLKEHENQSTAIDATLALADMAFERNMSERAEPHLEELDQWAEEGELNEDQQLTYNYLKAKELEIREEHEKSDQLIRTIYQEDPDFRDVKDQVQQQISELEPDMLPRKFQRMNKDSFLDFCRRIVEGMDYEYIESEFDNPEELDIVARERTMGLRVTRVLFTFKKWNETVGELPIKEFEFKIVENRHDEGYFASPAGFKAAAENYARGNESLSLIGPDKILSHFKDWYLSDIHGT